MEEELHTHWPFTLNIFNTMEENLFQNYWTNAYQYIPVLKENPCRKLYSWYAGFVPVQRQDHQAGIGIVHALLSLEARYEFNYSVCYYYFVIAYNEVREIYVRGVWTFETFIALSLLVCLLWYCVTNFNGRQLLRLIFNPLVSSISICQIKSGLQF